MQREWTNVMRRDASEKFYGELLKRYAVIIERTQVVEPQKKVAAAQ